MVDLYALKIASEKVEQIQDTLAALDEATTLIAAFTQTEENQLLLSKLLENIDDVRQIVSSVELMETTTEDINKGTFLGNRKTDIDIALNKVGIAQTITYESAMEIWQNVSNTVYYNKATATFVDGTVVEIPFVNDDLQPIQVSTHGAIVDQLNANVAFTDKLVNTALVEEVGGKVGTLIRIYDVTGSASNLERIELHATVGAFVNVKPVYFWAKTTSALQTLANRIGDIIALGNDIQSIIILSDRIDEMLELQEEIDKLVALHVNLAEVLAAKGHAQTATEKANAASASASAAASSASAASTSATTASSAAVLATQKANEIKGVSVGATITAAAGTNASVSYNSVDGKFTFVVPQGGKGDRGEAFQVNAMGMLVERAVYDDRGRNFSFLSIDESQIYFKNSEAVGDWSAGAPFGKGDKGPEGEPGNGIQSIAFVSTTHTSGLAAQSGGMDTYRIAFTNATTWDFQVHNGEDSAVSSVAGKTGDVVLAAGDIAGLENAISFVKKPIITSPTTGAVDFTGEVTASAYATSDTYQGARSTSIWQAATDSNFSTIVDSYTGGANLTTWTPSIGMALTQVWVRVRYESDGHLSAWSDAISFTTPNIFVETPTLTVDGSTSDVGETPTLTTSAFSVFNGSDTHESTDWQVVRNNDSVVVWESLADTVNLLSVTTGSLEVSTEYTFRVRHTGATYGNSGWVEVVATTKSAFAPMQGQKGFGIEPCPAGTPFAVLGLAEMPGTNEVGHDNYGNYIHTNGSIVCHYIKKYYRIGHPDSPRYATYGANAIDMEPMSAFADEAAANAAGYVLHRAFIDGGAEKSGFFRDKYKNSKSATNSNVAVSVKNGNPIGLATDATHTPSSTMTGCSGILADAVTLCRARGAGWNTQSAFIGGWSMLLSVAQGQAATSTDDVAWYDATLTTNFPKGCNNGSRADVNDTSVTWTGSPDTAAKGLTGRASNFAKSTDNGANNGCADVNGLMWEVTIGITNMGSSATSTTQIATNTIYALKTSAFLKDLTAGWNGATDAWGNTTNLSTRFDAITSPISLATAGPVYWGNGANAVFDSAASGVGRDLCGFLPKNDTSVNETGTNMFGNDYIYKYNVHNMVPLLSGSWSNAADAGVGCRFLSSYRSLGLNNAGFRAVAYV